MRLRFAFLTLILCLSVCAVRAQDESKIVVDKSLLTPEQLSKATHGDLNADVHSWVGLGREIGDAVNSSLSAVATQSNNFAQTPVGKLTAVLVVWKLIGQDVVHVSFALIEMLVFIPVWIWSYRRTCVDRRFETEKGKWTVVPYKPLGEFSVRAMHLVAAAILIGVFVLTAFAY